MPEISVILPVYNRAATLRRAIDSVLAQDFGDFELVVVDDASTDASASVAAAIDDPRLYVLAMPGNSGASAARNHGIRYSSGKVLCFLDSDDVYLPNKLSTVASRFREENDLGVLVDSFSTTYRRRGRLIERGRRNPVTTTTDTFLHALFSRQLWKATPSISVRREVAIAAGLFDEALRRREDFDFLIRAAEVARCASTDQRLWLKCDSPGSLSAPLATFVPATIELVTRHPHYASNPRYCVGLRRDLVRHFARLILSGRPLLFLRDLQHLHTRFGTPFMIELVAGGSRRRI